MLVLPVPPSTNVLWRNYRGRMVKSDAARAYELEVLACAKRARVKRISAPRPVAVVVRWYRGRKAGDLDNRLKAALDALRGVSRRLCSTQKNLRRAKPGSFSSVAAAPRISPCRPSRRYRKC